MSIVVDLLYNGNIKINDEISIKKILELADIRCNNDKVKSLKIETKDQNADFRPYVKIELFDENENQIEEYNSANGFYVDSDLIDFLFGIGPESVLGVILKENKTVHDKAKELYDACNNKNEASIEKLRK